ncbi:energy transducer TonB [Microvirga sp. ACRRW]|uniref:cell envelope integrity protein TolA n=1 Tax=Microvirga sp. ACRRW TaxID=2918205 RepID=UPI001EF69CCA|nr:cell envelope integrity protein TolA [Microvirga sp. ACRRW]MCG7393329.1 energy transducer TonB [Microvirga sp. ACRRW]
MSRLSTLLLASVVFSLSSPAAEAQDQRRVLIEIFQQQVRSCYILPEKERGAESVVVELRLEPNGALTRQPEVIHGLPDSLMARAALRAIDKCAPFKVPKEFASLYRDWRTLRIRFDAQ